MRSIRAQILGIGQLDVLLRARDQGDALAGGFEQGGIVGGARRGLAVQVEQEGEAEALRGLGAEQPVPRHGPGDPAVGAALQRVGDRDRRDRARGVARARRSPRRWCRRARRGGPRHGPARGPAHAGREPRARRGRSSCRVAPPGTAGRWSRPASAAVIGAASPTGCSSVTSRAERLGRLPDHRPPEQQLELLRAVSGRSGCRLPAATRMAATRMGGSNAAAGDRVKGRCRA